jgi:hypothetical protein
MFEFKPLSAMTAADVAFEMEKLRERNLELDRELAETARVLAHETERLKEPGAGGIWDPNADPSAAIEPSPEATAVAKMLADVELSQEQERRCAAIQQLFSVVLRPQFEAEMAQTKITDEIRQEWAKFRLQCQEEGLPHLPARPESLLMAIADLDTHSAQRLADAVSLVHKNLGEADPQDALVRAALRVKREDGAASAAEVKPEQKG